MFVRPKLTTGVGRSRSLALLLVLLLLAAACGGGNGEPAETDAPGDSPAETEDGTEGEASGEPIKVGVLMDLSQVYSFIGNPSLAGVEAAVDAINRDGGIDGRPIELVVNDDRTDPENARALYEEMANQGVVAVVGPNASATMVPLAPKVQEVEVPSLSLAAVSDLHRPARPYLYATGLHVFDSALIDAKWIADQGVDSPVVAALSLDTPAVAEFRESLEENIPDVTGGELVRNDVVAVDATDMTNAVVPIANENPDFVPVGLLATQLPGAVSSLRNRGVDAPVINYFVASDRATFEAVGDEEFYAVRQYVEPEEEPASAGLEQMRQDAEEAGVTEEMTSAYFTYGYVTTMLIAEALSNCSDPCDGPAVDEALSSITNFETNGLSGPLGVGEDDHLFVKYGRFWSWDGEQPVPETDWIGGRGTE